MSSILNEKQFNYLENLIKKHRKKELKLSDNDIQQLVKNGQTLLVSEFLKYLIVLLLAYFLNIFLTTFLVMTIFTVMRFLAGGVHMSSFNKCFIIMIFFFLSFGYLANHIHINFLGINIIYALSMIFAYKYSPFERKDKSDKDCNNGNKQKMLVMLFIHICVLMISLIYYYYKNILIINAITLGVLLEMITVTPWGIKFFQWIDNLGVHK